MFAAVAAIINSSDRKLVAATGGVNQRIFRLGRLAVPSSCLNPAAVNPLAGRKWFSWTRLIRVLGTVALVWLVLRKIDYAGFVEALRRTDVLWCAAAFAMYGVALTLQASRWHLALLGLSVAWSTGWRAGAWQ